MPNIPLPPKSEPFSSEGFQKVYDMARKKSQADRTQIANEIAANPIAVLDYLFILSPGQSTALSNAPAAFVQQQADVVVQELRSANPRSVPLDLTIQAAAATVAAATPKVSCSCARQGPT